MEEEEEDGEGKDSASFCVLWKTLRGGLCKSPWPFGPPCGKTMELDEEEREEMNRQMEEEVQRRLKEEMAKTPMAEQRLQQMHQAFSRQMKERIDQNECQIKSIQD